jgi:hypothetical protein
VSVRGVRGATTVERDEAEDILAATEELVRELVAANGLEPAEVASNIRRTWRLRPSWMVRSSSDAAGPARTTRTFAGSLRPSSSRIPSMKRFMSSPARRPCTIARYVFSTPKRG